MMKTNITKCPKCDRVKQYGVFSRLDIHAMQTIQMSKDIIVVIDETCEQCLNGEEVP